MPEPGRKEITGKRRYVCDACQLVFLDEELKGRYSRKSRKCIRCLVVEKSQVGEIELPGCFGYGYDGTLEECSSLCAVREACIIQVVENRKLQWELSPEVLGHKSEYHDDYGKMSFAQCVVRILKAAGRPMHWQDIWPIMEKLTVGRFMVKGEPKGVGQKELDNIRQSIGHGKDLVELSDNYFIWEALWSPEIGGRMLSKKIKGLRRRGVKSLNQILAEMEAYEDEKI